MLYKYDNHQMLGWASIPIDILHLIIDRLERDIEKTQCLFGSYNPNFITNIRAVSKHWKNACDIRTRYLNPIGSFYTDNSNYFCEKRFVRLSLKQLTNLIGNKFKYIKYINLETTFTSQFYWTSGISNLSTLPHLEALRIRDWGQASTSDLTGISTISTLTSLDIGETCYRCKISLQEISGFTKLTNLQKLNLSGTEINDEVLMTFTTLTSMQEINLAGCLEISDTGLKGLSKCLKLKNLNIASTEVTGKGLTHLKHLPELSSVNIDWCDCISKTGVTAILSMMHLKVLDLNGKSFVDDKMMKSVGKMSQLQYLNLTGASVTDIGISYLITLMVLETLYVDFTLVTDAAMSSIAKLTRLKALSLAGTPVSNNGILNLTSLKCLSHLSLGYGSKVTEDGGGLLQDLPLLKYITFYK